MDNYNCEYPDDCKFSGKKSLKFDEQNELLLQAMLIRTKADVSPYAKMFVRLFMTRYVDRQMVTVIAVTHEPFPINVV